MTEVSHRLRHHGKHHPNELWRATDLRDVITTTSPPAIDRTYTCYTTNEVLVIIGLTCVLNLAFLALVISCVHFCNSPTLTKMSRLESILVDNSTSDSDQDEAEKKKHTNAFDSRPISRRHNSTLPLQGLISQSSVLPLQSSSTGPGPRPRLKGPASSLSMECLLFV